MKILVTLIAIVMSVSLVGCAGTRPSDSKVSLKSPAKAPVGDTRPRPFPAGVK